MNYPDFLQNQITSKRNLFSISRFYKNKKEKRKAAAEQKEKKEERNKRKVKEAKKKDRKGREISTKREKKLQSRKKKQRRKTKKRDKKREKKKEKKREKKREKKEQVQFFFLKLFCFEFPYLQLCRPAYFVRCTQFLSHPGHCRCFFFSRYYNCYAEILV